MPFTCGDEQFFNVFIVRYVLKSGGGIFMDKKLLKDKLFQAVVKAYM